MITYPNVKVNLGLNVLRRRPDGYHDIETLFVPYFGMADVLEIVPADEFSIRITSSKPGIPDWDPMSDLCAKAWRLMNERFGVGPVAVLLEKRNPVGGGLGGGSSDGAFTLKMLNEIFSLDLAVTELASLAAELGSDCPFFIYNRPMIGEGRGEILSEFDLPDIDLGGEVWTDIIGTADNKFAGVFDGCGHVIKNPGVSSEEIGRMIHQLESEIAEESRVSEASESPVLEQHAPSTLP